jgi:hypothetical protein
MYLRRCPDRTINSQILVPGFLSYSKWHIFPFVDQIVVVGLVWQYSRFDLGRTAFVRIATFAGSDTIFPLGSPSFAAWHHMIYSQLFKIKNIIAVLALK